MRRGKPGAVIAFKAAKTGNLIRAAYEHPFAIRFCHWVNSVSLLILVASGFRVFMAFPSFGPKIPRKACFHLPRSPTLGGWLGGAFRWNFTFLWSCRAGGGGFAGF